MTKEKVAQKLYNLGLSPSYIGFDQCCEAVLYYWGHPSCKIVQELYPAVAKITETTAPRVERNIRTTIEMAFRRAEICSEFANIIDPDRGKLTNKEFISAVVLQLSWE